MARTRSSENVAPSKAPAAHKGFSGVAKVTNHLNPPKVKLQGTNMQGRPHGAMSASSGKGGKQMAKGHSGFAKKGSGKR